MHSFESNKEPLTKAKLGIVIINYRTAELTKDCVASLGPQLHDVDARVIIVDNASGDKSPDEIEHYLSSTNADWIKRIQLIRSESNTGFSGGNNLGLKRLDASYYLLLNSDTLVREGALEELLNAAARHPDAGIIAPRLEDRSGAAQKSDFRFISPFSEFFSAANLSFLERLFQSALVSNHKVPDQATKNDWVSFACVLISKAAVEKAGLMDEGYFMYFEDTDYCYSVHRAGFEVIYDPKPRVVHLRGGSSPVKKAIKERGRPPSYYYASRTRYFRKLYGPLGPTIANVAWYLGHAAAHIRLLAGRPKPEACLKQGSDIWINWRTPLGESHAPE